MLAHSERGYYDCPLNHLTSPGLTIHTHKQKRGIYIGLYTTRFAELAMINMRMRSVWTRRAYLIHGHAIKRKLKPLTSS